MFDGKIVDSFESFVSCHKPLSWRITKITGITDDDLIDAPLEEDVISDFYNFVGDMTLMAHNGRTFDSKFINKSYMTHLNQTLNNELIDTLYVFRKNLKELKSHKLEVIKEYYGIDVVQTHRALDDCHLLWECMQRLYETTEVKI